MQSQKRGYKVNSISTYLGLVVDVKKIIQIITNRLLDDKETTKDRLFYDITITEAKHLVDIITARLLDNKRLVKIRLFY